MHTHTYRDTEVDIPPGWRRRAMRIRHRGRRGLHRLDTALLKNETGTQRDSNVSSMFNQKAIGKGFAMTYDLENALIFEG